MDTLLLYNIRRYFANQNYLFSARAAARGILSVEIESAVKDGEIIEDYPNDKYGPSCLIMGYTATQRPLHIQVSYPPRVKIITDYEPSLDEWQVDLKTRKNK